MEVRSFRHGLRLDKVVAFESKRGELRPPPTVVSVSIPYKEKNEALVFLFSRFALSSR